MATESLVEQTVLCPACQQPVPLLYVNPKCYSNDSRESDGHVTSYRWIPGVRSSDLPHLYTVWQCPKCHFADLKDNLKEPHRTFKDEFALQAFANLPDGRRQVLARLRQLVPAGKLNHVGAISMHLAAILITLLPEDNRKISHSKLGKLALRLAWLYREHSRKQASFVKDTGVTLRALGQACEQIETHLAELREILGKVKQLGRDRSVELNQPQSVQENPYHAVPEAMETRLDAVYSSLNSLQMAVLQDQQGKAISAAPEDLGSSTNLKQSLLSIGSLWPGLPRNERQSLNLTVQALEFSYENEGDYQSVEESLAMVNLILDLLVRLGELERALEWTNTLSKYGYDTRTDLQDSVKKGRTAAARSAQDARSIQRKISTINVTMQRGGEKRRQIFQLMLERDKVKIEAILRPLATQSADKRMRALLEAGINSGVVNLLIKDETKALEKPEGSFLDWFRKKQEPDAW